MDNFGFIEYRPLCCKLATYAKQKNMLHISRGASPPLPMPAGTHGATQDSNQVHRAQVQSALTTRPLSHTKCYDDPISEGRCGPPEEQLVKLTIWDFSKVCFAPLAIRSHSE